MLRSFRAYFLGLAALTLLLGPASPGDAQQMGNLRGQVTDDDGNAIVGASVVAETAGSSQRFESTTDDEGRWSITGLRGGQWLLTASARGYVPTQGQARVTTLRPTPPMTFRLEKGIEGPLGALTGVDTTEIQADLQAGDLLFNAGQYDAALASYQSVLEKVPELTIVNLSIANCYRAKQEYDSAIGAYDRVLADDPTNEKALIGIGMTNLEKGDFAAAETTLAAAAETAGASAEVFYNLGEVKFVKGESDVAAEWYQKAVDSDPKWGKPLFKLALVALNKEDYDGATQYLQKLQEVDPASSEAQQATAVLEQIANR